MSARAVVVRSPAVRGSCRQTASFPAFVALCACVALHALVGEADAASRVCWGRERRADCGRCCAAAEGFLPRGSSAAPGGRESTSLVTQTFVYSNLYDVIRPHHPCRRARPRAAVNHLLNVHRGPCKRALLHALWVWRASASKTAPTMTRPRRATSSPFWTALPAACRRCRPRSR